MSIFLISAKKLLILQKKKTKDSPNKNIKPPNNIQLI